MMKKVLLEYLKGLKRKRVRSILEECLVVESMSILDIGGTPVLWKDINWKGRVILANLPPEDGGWGHHRISMPNLKYIVLNEKRLGIFKDKQFDFVFSNSVIEHLKTIESQRLFAAEVHRIGRGYSVQTPNKYFFIEPHFMFPYANHLPLGLRKLLLKYWPWRPFGIKDLHIAMGLRPLYITEMRQLFPSASITTERWFGMTKSIIATHPVEKKEMAL